MLLLIILAIIIALLFVYSLAQDRGKNTKFARKEADVKAQGSTMDPANMVKLS